MMTFIVVRSMQNQNKQFGRRHGYTLIQCLITMAIICSLCLFAQPSYFSLQQKHLATTTLKTIQQGLQYARMQAIVLHVTITIAPINPNSWSSGFIISNAVQPLKTYNFYRNQKISWNGFGDSKNKIYILPNGMTNNNGHFTLLTKQKPTMIYTMLVSKTLRTRIMCR